MLRLFHKYQRSLVVSLIMILICLGMIGFGVEFVRAPEDRAAITVGELKISEVQFERARDQFQDRLRSQFGKQYAQAIQALGIDIDQQAIDQLIAQTLLTRTAKDLGLAGGTEALQDEIRRRVGGAYSRAAYQTLLRQSGMNSEEYEQEIRDDLAQRLLVTVMSDLSQPSRLETAKSIELKNKHYTVNYLEIDPEQLKDQVAAPSPDELQKFYAAHPEDYTIPPQATYDYVVFRGADFEAAIQPSDDEIEAYLEDHREDFSVPEQAEVQHIQINYPKSSDPSVMGAAREKALRVLEQAQAGEDFSALALQHSDDLISKTLGGSLGWIGTGTRGDEFDEAVFGSADTGVLDLVETDYGFHVVKVSGRKERGLKPLAEVRDEIVRRIRSREAPAHASEGAYAAFDQWLESKSSLADFAKSKGLAAGTAANLTMASDPSIELTGLSKAILESPEDDRRVIELQHASVVVEIKEFKEPALSPFNEVQAIAAENYKIIKGRETAKELAESLLKKFKDGSETDLGKVALAAGHKTSEAADLSRAAPPKPPLAGKEFKLAIFGVSKPMTPPDRVIESDNKYYLVQVTKISSENPADREKQFAEARTGENQRLAYLLVSSILNKLKSQETIDVAPNLYRDQEEAG